jgi:iron only hydrogenase large subunit-like protein
MRLALHARRAAHPQRTHHAHWLLCAAMARQLVPRRPAVTSCCPGFLQHATRQRDTTLLYLSGSHSLTSAHADATPSALPLL